MGLSVAVINFHMKGLFQRLFRCQVASLSRICVSIADSMVFETKKDIESFLTSNVPKIHDLHLSEKQKSSHEGRRRWALPLTSTDSVASSFKTFLAFAAVNPNLRRLGWEEGLRRLNLAYNSRFSSTSSWSSLVPGNDGPALTWRECRLGLQETRRNEEYDSENSGAELERRVKNPGVSVAHRVQASKVEGCRREKTATIICRVLTGKKWWRDDIISTLVGMNLKLDTYSVAHVLKQQQRVQVALGFFYWTKEQEGYKHSTNVYNAIIGVVGSSRDFVALKGIMEDMQQDGCVPNTLTYNLIIKSFGAKNIDKALATFEHMYEVECSPDVTTYNTLIDLLVKAGDFSKAWSCYERMLNAGLEPDRITHNILYNSLVKSGRVDEACLLSKAYLPVSNYNTLIHFLGRDGHLDDALKVFHNMKDKGKPDNFTYSSLIKFLGKVGDVDSAWTLFQEMRNTSCIPDVVVYSAMMNAFRKAGKVDQVLSLFHEMKRQSCEADRESYSDLIHSLVEANRIGPACAFLKEMVTVGFEPKITTYSDVLWMLGNAGKVDEAYQVFKQMKEIWRKPRVNAYHAMIVAFSLVGRMDEALSIFMESKEEGCIPVRDMYSVLNRGFYKAGDLSLARNILSEMTENGFLLDFDTLNIPTSSPADKAFALLQKMDTNACAPDVATFTTLIQDFTDLGPGDLAFALFDDMKKKGCKPNVSIFNALIHFLCKMAKAEEAHKLLKEMEDTGCAPDDFTLAIMEEYALKVV